MMNTAMTLDRPEDRPAHPARPALCPLARTTEALRAPLRRARAGALVLCALAATALQPLPAQAGDRLLGTWGVSQVEGAAGGGLTPWAVIAGPGSSDQAGGSAYVTAIRTRGDFDLQIVGAAVGIRDRLELSMARWSFRFSDTVPGESARVDVLGAKLRVAGDAVYDQDRWLPQIAVGLQYKRNADYALVPRLLGARRNDDFDLYLSATKLWLGAVAGHNLLTSATLRATRANQFGILGFGGDGNDRHQLMPELSLGLMLRDDLVVGAEWRAKPDNLRSFKEESARDLFIAWFPSRHLSLTAAWVDLGNIADKPDQQGWYLSGQVSF